MKIFKILFTIIIASGLFTACDKIEGSYYESGIIPPPTTRVLLEDYTGHTCVACPSAHVIAEDLQNTYGDTNLIVVAVHAGTFANPGSSPYDYDFTTDAGDAYNTFFGITSYPNGVINRVKTGNNYFIDKNQWGPAVSKLLYEKKTMEVTIEANGNDTIINGSVKIDFIEGLNSQAKVIIWVTEDHIIKPQLNGALDYEHNHVLRGAVEHTWGYTLSSSTYSAGSTTSIEFSDYRIGEDWVMKNLSVVAFVYDDETKRVIQVNKAHVHI